METKVSNLDYTGRKIFVGIDVHDKNWVSTLKIGEHLKKVVFNSNVGEVVNYLKKNYPGGEYKLGYEAGCFGFSIARQIMSYGMQVLVLHPADIPTSDKENQNKTDKRDSKKIAQCLSENQMQGIYIPTVEQEQARSLNRRRQDIVKKSTRVKNQIKSLLKIYGVNIKKEFQSSDGHWTKKFIEELQKYKLPTAEGNYTLESLLHELLFFRDELLQINRNLRKLSRTAIYNNNVTLLISIPGIGLVTAMTLLTELIDIHRFADKDHLVSFVGLYPNEHSSGEKKRIGHLTKRSNRHIRYMLIEAAWIAIRQDPVLEKYYIDETTKIGKQRAIVKVARKLLIRIRHMLLHNEKYKMNLAV